MWGRGESRRDKTHAVQVTPHKAKPQCGATQQKRIKSNNMKRTLTLFAALVLLAVGAAAQKLSYSAVVRNSANELVANQTLTVVVSIANSNGGPAVYSETHSGVQTNQNGLLTLVIGDGGSQAGSMSDVTWSTAYITSDYTMPDGAHVTNTVPVTAVPYALSAGNVEGGFEQVNADWNATSGAAQILNKPEIPVVNDGTLTIQKNGQEVGTFTANQAGNTTVNITITAQDILDAVSGMTPEQKSQLCQALNCGGEPGPSEPTTFTCGTSTVEDHQHNVYHTVQIGTQCWTRENMRCTTSPKGNLTMGSEDSYDQPYYYNNTSTSANYNIPLEDRGMYYNWAGAMDTVFASTDNRNVSFEGRRGICPEGWHVPSDAEWTTLTEYVSNNHACNGNSEYNAKALAIDNENYWNRGDVSESFPCEPEYDPATNNATGFSAVPSGLWYDGFNLAGNYANFWSSSSISGDYAYDRSLSYNNVSVYRYNNDKYVGFSVRCLKDATGGGGTTPPEPTPECPALGATTIENSNDKVLINTVITDYDAEKVSEENSGFRVSVTLPGATQSTEMEVTAASNSSSNNLTSVSIVTDNDGTMLHGEVNVVGAIQTYFPNYTSSQIAQILSLIQSVTITPFLSVACNGDTWSEEGEPVEYTLPTTEPSEPTTFTCGTSTVEDHQHNVYHTVQIGTQCWTRENMRCTTSPKGNLTMGSEDSYDQPYYYNNTSTSANYNIPLEDRGMYYNWAGAMDTVFASTDNRNVSFEGRRGICPEGWHVPSDAEWTTLTEYVSNNHACNGNSEYNAKALAIDNENYWNRGDVSESFPCEPEYDPATNNATGFSAVPSGVWNDGFLNAGNNALFWSSSSDSGYYAYARVLSYYFESVPQNHYTKNIGFSVRCIKDND